jgi:hypothetical protein
MKCALLALILCTLSAPTLGQGYPPGRAREAFIDASNKTCLAKQVSAEANKGFAVEKLKAYCDCYSVYLANSVTESMMTGRLGPTSPEAQALIEAAAQQCVNRVLKAR